MALERITDALYSLLTLSKVERVSVMQARSEISELPKARLFGKLNAYAVNGLDVDIGENPVEVNEEGSGQFISLAFSKQAVPYVDGSNTLRYFLVVNMGNHLRVRKVTSRKGVVRFELEGIVENPENYRARRAYFYRVSEVPT
ncbi:hypothetical protein HYY73_03720 [Candidatus Woesearchaeota archaeon]|nr:hypothetical protein [Candidatus Woesearchaeota archaeon]